MQDPLFWLLLSFLLVALSLTAVLAAAFPAFLELGRAARSAEKLLDTLNRELPRTLDALRRTGGDITELTDELEASFKKCPGDSPADRKRTEAHPTTNSTGATGRT